VGWEFNALELQKHFGEFEQMPEVVDDFCLRVLANKIELSINPEARFTVIFGS